MSTNTSRSKELIGLSVVVLVVFGAIALRGLRLWTGKPLWYDEAMYVWLVENLQWDLFRGHDVLVEPLFASLLSLIVVENASELWLRLHAAVAGVLAVIAVGFLAREIGGRRGMLPGLALASVSPVLIHYSGELKMYAWVILLQTLCMIAMLKLPRTRSPAMVLVGYVIAASAYCNTVFSAPLFFVALNLVYLALYPAPRHRLYLWVAAQVVVVVASIPYVVAARNFAESMSDRVFHAGLPTWSGAATLIGNLSAGMATADGLRAAILVMLTAASIVAVALPRPRLRQAWAVALVMTLQVTFLAILSIFGTHSLFVDRYVVGISGLWLALAARGFACLSPWPRVIGVVVLLAVMGASLAPIYDANQPAQRRSMGVIEPLDAPAMAAFLQVHTAEDAVVAHAFWETEPVMRWYLPEYPHELVQQDRRMQRGLDAVCSRGFQQLYGWAPQNFWAFREKEDTAWLLLPEEWEGWEHLYAGLLAACGAHGDFISGASFRKPGRFNAGIYGYAFNHHVSIPAKRDAIRLPARKDDGQLVPLDLRIEERERGQWELRLGEAQGFEADIRYQILDVGYAIPAVSMTPLAGESSYWSVERDLDRESFVLPYMKRRSLPAEGTDPLEARLSLPMGHYGVFVLGGEGAKDGRETLTNDFEIRFNGVPLDPAAAVPHREGWLHVGHIHAPGGEVSVTVNTVTLPSGLSTALELYCLAFVPEGQSIQQWTSPIVQTSVDEAPGRFVAKRPLVAVAAGPYTSLLWDHTPDAYDAPLVPR